MRTRTLLTPIRRSFVAAAVLSASVASASAAPTVSASTSTTQARKGQPFHVYLEIATDEAIEKLEIVWTAPTGFSVEHVNKNAPDPLVGSFISDLLVTPPGFSWSPNAPGSDTREQKTLTFDVAYTAMLNGRATRIHRATKVSFPYSLGPGPYLLTGMLGLLLGNIIKTLTTHKRDFAEMLNAQSSSTFGVLQAIGDLVFRREVVGLMTSLAIGFIVLLVLARDEIPTRGWYDSLALGVSLAILADDQLLTKLKV